MSLNATNRSEKGFKMHKSLQMWGWLLPKKWTSPPKGGGVEVGILGGQKIKSTGNVMNCPDNQYNLFLLTHPTPGGSGGGGVGSQNLKSPVNFMKCREKNSPPTTKGGRSGNFSGSEKSKVREMS